MQGAKYKRRWVEVTEHTFVYSPSQQDALTGRCSVFAIGDMMWVKADGDTKFMVRGSWGHLCLQLIALTPRGQTLRTTQRVGQALRDAWWVLILLQVKFPERTLKFKVAAGGKAEREQWVAALQAARKQHTAATQALNSGTAKLEHLQKVC